MLSLYLKQIVRAVKGNGGAITPAQLSEMERKASLAFDGAFVTTTAPFAPVTWQGETVLASSSSVSGRVDLRFNRPVEIVGLYPSIVAVGSVGRDATLDDVACQIDIDRQSFRTSSITDTNQTSNFVVLGALACKERQLGLHIETPSPNVGLTFAWRVPTGTCKDSLIAVTTFCRWLDQEG